MYHGDVGHKNLQIRSFEEDWVHNLQGLLGDKMGKLQRTIVRSVQGYNIPPQEKGYFVGRTSRMGKFIKMLLIEFEKMQGSEVYVKKTPSIILTDQRCYDQSSTLKS